MTGVPGRLVGERPPDPADTEGTAVTATDPFAFVVVLTAAAGLLAVLSSRVTSWSRVPAPALFLVAAAAAAALDHHLRASPRPTVERLVTVALVAILFDGGMHLGRARLTAAAGPVAATGILGTFLTAAGAATLVHGAFGLGWYPAALVGTAVAPTDPAVVFSVLGRREVAGRSGTILEGESGANDPVGIALMAGLVAAGGVGAGALGGVAGTFVLQMAIGMAVGLLGGRALVWLVRQVPLPGEGLYPLRTLAGAFLLFGVGVVAHGSGFLAVFVAGVVAGDEEAPFQREIERFHGALASLGEIVAFVALGLTVDLGVLAQRDVWLPGIVLGAVLAFVIRPLAVGLCLVPARLDRNERRFVSFAGLKGAVPILLGTYLFGTTVHQPARLYGIVVVVVLFSVVVQGGLVPVVARVLSIPMRLVEPEPFSLGVRLRRQPDQVSRVTVAASAPADGRTVAELAADGLIPEGMWISLLVRDGVLVPVGGATRLEADDDLVVLAEPGRGEEVARLFGRPAAG